MHGSRGFANPVPLTPTVIDSLDVLTPLATLYQPRGLAPIGEPADFRRPTRPALRGPRSSMEGIRRYGFHRISY